MVLATLLADHLAGKNVGPRIDLLSPGKPGMRPEEKLRLALDQVEGRRKLLDAADDAFGRCDVCAADLGEAAITDMPWADRCPAHPGA
jgi:hypothetical protein